ncbi:hypothetical protein MHT86_00010 [Corynebacterium mastitidis]|uniref:Uncharacterized protein n=1 Tax=Corynebacterium mastitidis TaxID=161890 RepID=A0A2N0X6R9_9CORY|nr:hypothetical protein [Corynebacterium mastitidis]MCH6195892.1 hypothetical protein [Corynebacterium mastitidis]PKF68380.1 hypothetical protein CXB45_07530 [Corynebacterium mastitidis]
MSKFIRGGIAAACASVMALGVASAASAEESAAGYEEHLFTGSSTSVAAFQEWFAGGEFVQPEIETRDLRELEVNEFETAESGDTIYKDDQGRFWIKQDAIIT